MTAFDITGDPNIAEFVSMICLIILALLAVGRR